MILIHSLFSITSSKVKPLELASQWLLALVLFYAPKVYAAPLSLSEATYNYKVIDQDLQVALKDFGTNLNIKVDISSEVKGRIRGSLPPGSPAEFLDTLSKLFSFDYYFDGQILYVSDLQQRETRFLPLGDVSFTKLKVSLESFELLDARFVLREGGDARTAYISGPPRFVELVAQTLTALQTRRPLVVGPKTINVPDTLTIFKGAQTSVVRFGPR